MQVQFIGFEEDEIDHLAAALKFFCKILFHGNMLNRMSFFIQKRTDLDIQGECWPEDAYNRTFVIDVRCGKDDDEPCATLAHELVHCKQWAMGELGSTSTVVARTNAVSGVIELGTSFVETWHGKIWKPKRGEHPYFDSPWEVEAYGKGLGMMARWTDYQEQQEKRKHKNEIVKDASDVIIVTSPPDLSDCPNFSAEWPDYYGGA